VQLYRYFVSQSSEFCCHNPLCCNIKGKLILYLVIDSVRKLSHTPSYVSFIIYALININTEIRSNALIISPLTFHSPFIKPYNENEIPFKYILLVGLFLFAVVHRPVLELSKPPSQCVPGALSTHLQLVSSVVELNLHSTNMPSWRGTQLKHRDKFTLSILLSNGYKVFFHLGEGVKRQGSWS
jgi:hypothetical protein